MDRFAYNDEFEKGVIYEKLAELSSKLEKERAKDEKERDYEKERELIYAQFIQGLKLNTMYPKTNIYF